MKISIVVPVYKVEKYLKKCVNSLINQTYKNLEIILVDDGSPDNSGMICDEFLELDKRVKVLHKENGGLSDARNEGIKLATGDFILFVDSDDYLELDGCQNLVDVIKNTKADVVSFNLNIVDENGSSYDNLPYCYDNTKKIIHMNYNNAIIDTIYRKHIRFEACSKIYKSDIFDDIEFPVGMLAEDFAIFESVIKKSKKLVYFDNNIYNYLQRSDSIMGQKNPKLYIDIYKTERIFNESASKVCINELDKIENECRHFKSLLKCFCKTYFIYKDNNIKDMYSDIKKVKIKYLTFKLKVLYIMFLTNYKFFVKLFNIIYKKA